MRDQLAQIPDDPKFSNIGRTGPNLMAGIIAAVAILAYLAFGVGLLWLFWTLVTR